MKHLITEPDVQPVTFESVFGKKQTAGGPPSRGAHTAVRRNGRTVIRALAAALFLTLWTVLVSGITAQRTRTAVEAEAAERYSARVQEIIAEQNAAAKEQAAVAAATADYVGAEAEHIARVLYGVKNNSTDDLRTAVWCVLNRVDNAAYPDTIEEVVAQPTQWMGYSEDNPVLTELYDIAREQLETWYAGGHRPVSDEFVYLSWTRAEIVLRDNWKDGSGTHYWKWRTA